MTPEEEKEYKRKWYLKNRERILKERAVYREENKEKISETKKLWRLKNAEIVKAKKKEYYEKNKEYIKTTTLKYYHNNKEAIAQRRNGINRKPYTDEQRSAKAAAARRRRARKLSLPNENYTEQMVISLYGSRCHLCHQEIDLSAPRRSGQDGWEKGLHIDHVIPISLGGPDTLDNVRPSHGYCNTSKGNKIKTSAV